jgi:hypothetical protein
LKRIFGGHARSGISPSQSRTPRAPRKIAGFARSIAGLPSDAAHWRTRAASRRPQPKGNATARLISFRAPRARRLLAACCSSHLVCFDSRRARAKAFSRMPGNKTRIQTRAADHGFGEQPQPNTSLTGQATVALPEARAAKRYNSLAPLNARAVKRHKSRRAKKQRRELRPPIGSLLSRLLPLPMHCPTRRATPFVHHAAVARRLSREAPGSVFANRAALGIGRGRQGATVDAMVDYAGIAGLWRGHGGTSHAKRRTASRLKPHPEKRTFTLKSPKVLPFVE